MIIALVGYRFHPVQHFTEKIIRDGADQHANTSAIFMTQHLRHQVGTIIIAAGILIYQQLGAFTDLMTVSHCFGNSGNRKIQRLGNIL